MGRLLEDHPVLITAIVVVALLLMFAALLGDIGAVGALALIMLATASVPISLGCVIQLLLRRRALPLFGAATLAVLLMVPWWFWGQGVYIAFAGPKLVSLLVSVAFHTVFIAAGALGMRRIRARRRGDQSSPAAEG